MSKAFSMMNASRRLENHLSREYYNLDRMSENTRIPSSLFETKVRQYNELVDTLNDLFSSLTSTQETLFKRYPLGDSADMVPSKVEAVTPLVTNQENQMHTMDDPDSLSDGFDSLDDGLNDESITHGFEAIQDVGFSDEVSQTVATTPTVEVESQTDNLVDATTAVHSIDMSDSTVVNHVADTHSMDGLPTESVLAWQAEGYASYEEWCADKDVESAEIPDDLTVGVNSSLSQYRAGQALSEYQETSEQDITTYNPEDDAPVSVFPQKKSMRPTEDLRYLNHTADGIRVDEDPTQIAEVETAVERDYENSRKGTDLDISSYMYRSDNTVVDNLIDDELSKLHVDDAKAD